MIQRAQFICSSGIGFGVFWAVWGIHGFWWGVVYGLCWPIWAGYRLALYLVQQ